MGLSFASFTSLALESSLLGVSLLRWQWRPVCCGAYVQHRGILEPEASHRNAMCVATRPPSTVETQPGPGLSYAVHDALTLNDLGKTGVPAHSSIASGCSTFECAVNQCTVSKSCFGSGLRGQRDEVRGGTTTPSCGVRIRVPFARCELGFCSGAPGLSCGRTLEPPVRGYLGSAAGCDSWGPSCGVTPVSFQGLISNSRRFSFPKKNGELSPRTADCRGGNGDRAERAFLPPLCC